MHNADLYQQSNSLQKRDAILCLEKYSSTIKWNNSNNQVLDIGCGDGSVTNMLKKYLPQNIKLTGCDISENMVNFANKHYGNDNTSFSVLDIAGDVPQGLKGNFGHVFSFYALHWILDQERVFNNIYNLLDQDGECFLVFLACNPIFDVYRILARNNKWSTWLQDAENYISPYQDSQEPDKEIRKIMTAIGYIDLNVEVEELVFVYEDMDTLRRAVTSVNPFHIPQERYNDFLEDYVEALKQIQVVDKANNNDSATGVTFNYKLLVVQGRKPPRASMLCN